MHIEKSLYGRLRDKDIYAYKLINDNDMSVTFLNLGGTNISLIVKGKDGKARDIVLQYKDVEHIEECPCFFGVIVARNANRIKDAMAKISSVDYKLDDNDKGNNLHSGKDYFHNKILNAKTFEDKDEVSVEFSYTFKDMEQGYPGNMDFRVRYILNNNDELKIRYEATSDKDTIFNPTWHSYFNLCGHDYGKIDTHKIKIEASKYTYVSDKLIPEKLEEVKGTPLDFYIDFRYMNDKIDDNDIQIQRGGGFDHNFCIDKYDGKMNLIATVKEDISGINMQVFSEMPGVQFYSGNSIKAPYKGKDNATYVRRGGFCLETQYFPNAINDERFVSPLLKSGEKKVLNTIYKFSINN